MRASVIRNQGAASFEELKPVCQVLILHEDFPAYSHAVEICRGVMERFASELDFNIKCWSFIELADPNCARHAGKTAGAADIILLSTRADVIPTEVERWLDAFFATRFRPDGILALLTNARSMAGPPALAGRLEKLATRFGMDFLSLLPDDDIRAILPRRAAEALRQARK